MWGNLLKNVILDTTGLRTPVQNAVKMLVKQPMLKALIISTNVVSTKYMEYTLLQKKCTLISPSSGLGSNMQKTLFENSLLFSCSTQGLLRLTLKTI